MSTFRRRLMMAIPQGGGGHNLPPEYQEVKWISNPGSTKREGAIDTGLKLDNTSYGIKVMTKVRYAAYWAVISTGWYADALYLGAGGSQQTMLSGFGSFDLHPYDDGDFMLIEANFIGDGHFKINGEVVPDVSATPYRQSKNTAILGMMHVASQMGGCPEVVEIVISQGSEIIRDWIPCYRKSDGVRGLYDIMGSIYAPTNSSFYTNEPSETSARYSIGENV